MQATALLMVTVISLALLNYYGLTKSMMTRTTMLGDTTELYADRYHVRTSAISNKVRKMAEHGNDTTRMRMIEDANPALDPNVVRSAAPSPARAEDPEHLLKKLYPGNYDDSNIHIVYSTSCYQGHRMLLSATLQLSATRSGQKGPITQIISGCKEEDKAKILEEPRFYYDFRIHFSPGYSPTPVPGVNDDYSPYNKPFSLRDFLLTADPPVKHDIVALIDGDFVFFKPMEVNTGRVMSKYYRGSRNASNVTDEVSRGVAIAQDWRPYMGSGWFAEDNGRAKKLCEGRPCDQVTPEEALEYYAGTGPPYIMTRRDMQLFVEDYCNFVVTGRTMVDDDWMTEMYGYAVAAANHGIRHTVLSNLGVTHPEYENEGNEYWSFIDDNFTANPCADPFNVNLPEDPPIGLHYCQEYGLYPQGREAGGQYFYKYGMPREIIECSSELLALPSADDWNAIDTLFADDPSKRVFKRHEVWTECAVIKSINHALRRLKEAICPSGFNTFQAFKMIREPATPSPEPETEAPSEQDTQPPESSEAEVPVAEIPVEEIPSPELDIGDEGTVPETTDPKPDDPAQQETTS
ncbi:TPA: hypothetical protein N0F65_004377 [Lagenidium giganteum]|uniref:Uncharacterized protein n=1 Tax=Lagenidium giganteum TaxID=4803 RepID=A0AAV2ZG68_9STRA|nr:TPA: hypothetical protein N0F65_004377 [Lagenidium giganteum]